MPRPSQKSTHFPFGTFALNGRVGASLPRCGVPLACMLLGLSTRPEVGLAGLGRLNGRAHSLWTVLFQDTMILFQSSTFNRGPGGSRVMRLLALNKTQVCSKINMVVRSR